MTKVDFMTDVGRKRVNNQDAIVIILAANIYGVADGVGGHSAGEVASQNATLGMREFIEENPIENTHKDHKTRELLLDYFLKCFDFINEKIISVAKANPDNFGMATTMVAAHVFDENLYVINVGDSRAYIIRNKEISQITVDHTYVNTLVEMGEITIEEADSHPRKNEITRALGVQNKVVPDFFTLNLLPGDKILLCSDGLHGELSDGEINHIVSEGKNEDDICKSLVEKANEKGGKDNISVVCIEI